MTKMVTLICQYGETHEWERESQRGRKPIYCPEHRHMVDPAAAALKAVTNAPVAHVAPSERLTEERDNIALQMPELEAAYEIALAKAIRTNTSGDWNAADVQQSRIIGMIARKRTLDSRLRAN